MAIYRKGFMHLSGLRLYVCYPFWSSLPQEQFNETMIEVYSYGIVPIIAMTYVVRRDHHLLDRNNIYSTIALCDGILLLHEQHLTRNMLAELMYASKIHLPVYRIEP